MNVNSVNDIGNGLAAQEIKSVLLAAVVAAADVAETVIGSVGTGPGLAIGTIVLTVPTPVVSNDTNYTIFTVNKRTAGGAPVVLATGTFKTAASGGMGSVAAFSNVKLTVVVGASVAGGDVLTYAITHGGTGVAVPASVLEIFPSIN